MESEKKKYRRRLGDRKDGALIRDMDGIHIAMANCYLNRTDNEAYISEEIDLEPLNAWIEAHREDDTEFPYTFFHIFVTAMLKTLWIRPKLNRFISNRNYYQRFEKTASFIAKKKFSDDGGESMVIVHADEDATLATIHQAIKERVTSARSGGSTTSEDGLDFFRKAPRNITKVCFNFIRFLDRHGWLPRSVTDTDSNYSSVFITNLGSIKLKCGYHHLSNYGTSSIFIVIGEKKKRPFYDEAGNVTMKETVRVGLTIDERIADGYYYAKSVKVFKYLLEHPELLERPMAEELSLEF